MDRCWLLFPPHLYLVMQFRFFFFAIWCIGPVVFSSSDFWLEFPPVGFPRLGIGPLLFVFCLPCFRLDALAWLFFLLLPFSFLFLDCRITSRCVFSFCSLVLSVQFVLGLFAFLLRAWKSARYICFALRPSPWSGWSFAFRSSSSVSFWILLMIFISRFSLMLPSEGSLVMNGVVSVSLCSPLDSCVCRFSLLLSSLRAFFFAFCSLAVALLLLRFCCSRCSLFLISLVLFFFVLF